ncbi:hypothetical protein VP01_1738g1 [Puccinia sorghi]|uniref:Uncharacterized protein n=1 Tax=Puccinia sorghi TaxID=27349 RepID=A0A0L6VF57_9BASI|nr:hypothetical protein VP01_1738g1 [Puccinia sorghi]
MIRYIIRIKKKIYNNFNFLFLLVLYFLPLLPNYPSTQLPIPRTFPASNHSVFLFFFFHSQFPFSNSFSYSLFLPQIIGFRNNPRIWCNLFFLLFLFFSLLHFLYLLLLSLVFPFPILLLNLRPSTFNFHTFLPNSFPSNFIFFGLAALKFDVPFFGSSLILLVRFPLLVYAPQYGGGGIGVVDKKKKNLSSSLTFTHLSNPQSWVFPRTVGSDNSLLVWPFAVEKLLGLTALALPRFLAYWLEFLDLRKEIHLGICTTLFDARIPSSFKHIPCIFFLQLKLLPLYFFFFSFSFLLSFSFPSSSYMILKWWMIVYVVELWEFCLKLAGARRSRFSKQTSTYHKLTHNTQPMRSRHSRIKCKQAFRSSTFRKGLLSNNLCFDHNSIRRSIPQSQPAITPHHLRSYPCTILALNFIINSPFSHCLLSFLISYLRNIKDHKLTSSNPFLKLELVIFESSLRYLNSHLRNSPFALRPTKSPSSTLGWSYDTRVISFSTIGPRRWLNV